MWFRGGHKGDWGGICPPSLYVKKGPAVDGNYRVYILYTFIKPNQEQLQKMQLYIYVGPLAGNEPAIPVQRL
jgi:hypothetical protein